MANKYLFAAAAGSANGNDWTNAYTTSAQLAAGVARGDVVYVAEGNYLKLELNTAESSTTRIAIQAATVASHGTATGWSDSMVGQAIFAELVEFEKGYYTFDGVYRNEDDWKDGDAYGFKVNTTTQTQQIRIGHMDDITGAPSNGVHLNCIFIQAPTTLPAMTIRQYAIDTEAGSATTGVEITKCFVKDGNNSFFMRSSVAPLIEFCAATGQRNNDDNHAETVNLYFNTPGAIVRYNIFNDFCTVGTRGTAVIALTYSDGCDIYGNVFDTFCAGDGAIGFDGNETNDHKIYNNTFVNGSNGNSGIAIGAGTGNEIWNNMWVNCVTVDFIGATISTQHNYNAFSGGSTKGEANGQSGITDAIFVNYATRNLHLASNTNAGTTLSSPYDEDMDGVVRGSGGEDWSRGAYQLTDDPPPGDVTINTTNLTSTNLVIG